MLRLFFSASFLFRCSLPYCSRLLVCFSLFPSCFGRLDVGRTRLLPHSDWLPSSPAAACPSVCLTFIFGSVWKAVALQKQPPAVSKPCICFDELFTSGGLSFLSPHVASHQILCRFSSSFTLCCPLSPRLLRSSAQKIPSTRRGSIFLF